MFLVLIIAVLSVVSTEVMGYRNSCIGGCRVNGYCYRHGQTWPEGCNTKRCVQIDSNYARIENYETRCKDAYGVCRNHGDQMTVNMNGYGVQCRCAVNSAGSWSYTQCVSKPDVKPNSCDCNTSKGCRTFGQTWKENCFTMKCMRNGSGWKTEAVKAECEDAYRNCKQNGQRFTKIVGGQWYRNCVCNVRGMRAGYSC